jgi:hypothetical protein
MPGMIRIALMPILCGPAVRNFYNAQLHTATKKNKSKQRK